MRTADFDFELPPEAIAQRPAPRGTARLMTLDRRTGAIGHRRVADLPDLLRAGDVLVPNETKVVPARLFGRDERGAETEFLLVARQAGGGDVWECLAKPGRRASPGRAFDFGESLLGRVEAKTPEGRLVVRFSGTPLADALPRLGTAPLPPYIRRAGGRADARDANDYQTVFAREEGAIAAPTAGLHFTADLLDAVRERGVEIAPLVLHVGLGTFRPVKAENAEEHVMDAERGSIPETTATAVNRARAEGRRVVAVGSTAVRSLEASAATHGGRVAPGPFETRLFVTPGFSFRAVDAMLTNFHLPKSTLVMLVSAFAGREAVLGAYRTAVTEGYRFFSYGDAMFLS